MSKSRAKSICNAFPIKTEIPTVLKSVVSPCQKIDLGQMFIWLVENSSSSIDHHRMTFVNIWNVLKFYHLR